MSSHHHEHGHGGHWREYGIIGATGLLVLVYWLEWLPTLFGVDTALLAAVIGGVPIIKEAAVAIYQRGDTKVGLLVSIAIIAAIAIGEYFAAAEVALIMTIGEMLEHMTLEKSNTALQKLAALTPLKARLLEAGGEREIAAAEVNVGDRLLIKPGEKVPVDGVIVEGRATLDQSMITGESLPVEVTEGSSVFGGTIVTMGSVKMLASKVGQDTALGHIIKMVEAAQATKAPSARIIDRWANWFVPLSLSIAALVFAVTGDVVRAVTILIVFCPCAMLLSTPTAVAAAIGAAARRGILIKGGETLEKIGQLDTILLDKTGTITVGKPSLQELYAYAGWHKEELLAIAAGIEKRSEHHLAKAILQAAEREQVSLREPNDWAAIIGQGVEATYGNQRFWLGNRALLAAEAISLLPEQEAVCEERQNAGETVVFLATAGKVIGLLAIKDALRYGAKQTITALQASGLQQIALLTGDTARVGNAVGRQVGIATVHGDLFPADKVSYVAKYQQAGRRVAMIGDGINDAPALAKADVGIAMGFSGTDVAMEAADVVLLSDDLSKIPETMQKSRQAIRTIWQNIMAANLINLVAIVMAAFGWLGPVAAAIVHNAGAILVVLNSARLLRHTPGAASAELLPEREYAR